MSANNNLSKIFGIENSKNQELILADELDNSPIDQTLKDFEKVRNNIIDSVKLGQMALSDLSALAAASQDDKYYSSLAKLLMAVTVANKTLVDIHEKKLGIVPKEQSENTTINNNLYLTTAEFIELQSKKNEKNGDE